MTAPPFPVDPKRASVAARLIRHDDPAIVARGNERFAPPGSVVLVLHSDGASVYGYAVACPGCGRMWRLMTGEQGKPTVLRWSVTTGRTCNPATVSLEPGIDMRCCKWWGALIEGWFLWGVEVQPR